MTFNLDDAELTITHADFLEDLRPNVLLVAFYNASKHATTVKLLKIKSSKNIEQAKKPRNVSKNLEDLVM
jgi:hypothetical protein